MIVLTDYVVYSPLTGKIKDILKSVRNEHS